MCQIARSWVVVVSRSSSEYATADCLRRAGYRVYLPQRKVRLMSARAGDLALRPLWPGYLFAQDWRGWPERHVEGEPRLLKCGGDIVELPSSDVMRIIDRELTGAFDPVPAMSKQRRGDIRLGDAVGLTLADVDIRGTLEDLSDDGRAVVRAMMLGRETIFRDVPQDDLRAVCA